MSQRFTLSATEITAKMFSSDNHNIFSLCFTVRVSSGRLRWSFGYLPASRGLGIHLHHRSIIAMRLSWETEGVTAESGAVRKLGYSASAQARDPGLSHPSPA